MTQTTDTLFTGIEPDFSPQINEENALEALVGEGKKFRDPNALAVSKLKADEFIERLKAENASYRKQLEGKQTMESFIEELRSNKTPVATNDTNTGTQQLEEVSHTALSKEDLVKEVLAQIENRDKAAKANQNLETVRRNMTERFGPSWETKVAGLAASNDIPIEVLEDLARKSPAGFERVLGLSKQNPSGPSLFNTALDSTGFNGQNTSKRNMAYYDNLKKKDPGMYNSREVQIQMHNDAIRQGSSFFE